MSTGQTHFGGDGVREVLGSFAGRQFLDHSVFTVLAFQGNIVLILRLMCSKKIMIRVMIVVINIVFLKKIYTSQP